MTAPAPRLQRLRARARAVLLAERLWPALWPAAGIAGACVCLILLDLPRALPPAVHVAALAAALIAIAGLALRGLRGIRLPDAAAADRRLELDSGLAHRPLAALTDRPALPGAEALWQAHVARAWGQMARLRLGWPRPGMAARDPRALRLGLAVALAACIGIAGPDAPDRLARGIWPRLPLAAPAAATEVQAWIVPPGYTGLPPLTLPPGGGAVTVPAASHLTVSLSGGSGTPALRLGEADLPFAAVEGGAFQADADLTEGGVLALRRGGGAVADWTVTVLPNAAPVPRWTEPPGEAQGGGKTPSTRLPWDVSHAYGVAGLQAELRLAVRPDAPPLTVEIPLPGGNPKAAKGVRTQDLTAHPWAGLAVSGSLIARDVTGQTGTSETAEFVLPERKFDNPTARALLEVRKNLSLWPRERLTAGGALDRISREAAVWQGDPGALLNLRAIIAEILHTRGDAAVPDAQARLWLLALHLEEAGPDKTARVLAQARAALKEAMQAPSPDQTEIEKRIAELEDAIRKHLDALTEALKHDPDAVMNAPDDSRLNARDLQKLAEALKQDLKQGKPQDAKQKLAELEKLLDKLQSARPMHKDAQQRMREQKRQRGQDDLNALQDIVRREGGVMDRAQARSGPQQSGAPPQAGAAERGGDQRIQQALRRALGEVMQQFGDLTGTVPPNLGDADAAMRQTIDALGHAQEERAVAAARAAIEALQKGGESMSEMMAQQFGRPGDQQGDQGNDPSPGAGTGTTDEAGGEQSQGDGQRSWQGRPAHGKPGETRTDPLGRPVKEGANGNTMSTDVGLPEEMEQARTRAIQQELRKREGERTRPQPELDYIERLLKPF